MLTLDSPRWEQLNGTYGKTTVHLQIREFLGFLDTNPDGESLKATFDDFCSEMSDELFHQQCTWTATPVAMPHLLKLAKQLPTEQRGKLIHTCGVFHLEIKYPDAPDFQAWYDEAIELALDDTIEFVKSNSLKIEEQFDFLGAIAYLDGELYVYYALREIDYFETECTQCHGKVVGYLDKGGYVVFIEGEAVVDWKTETVNGKTTPVKVCNDLSVAVKQEKHKRYALVSQVAQAGNHHNFVSWLHQFLGTYQCPHCDQPSLIDVPPGY